MTDHQSEARSSLGGLCLGLAIGAAVGVALGLALERGQGQEPLSFSQQVESFWRRARQRWQEALAAGREAARQADAELRRRYQETLQKPRRRRR